MSSTNKTTNYQLSQYVGSDKPTYLGDYNGDMLKIDTAIKQTNNIATEASSGVTEAVNLADSANTKANSVDLKVGDLNNLTTSEKTSIVGAINENHSGLATEISKTGDLSSLNTSVKTNIVNALNEVNGKTFYSTDETICGKWIDGKNLYRKVVQFQYEATNWLSSSRIFQKSLGNILGTTFVNNLDTFLVKNFYIGSQNKANLPMIYVNASTTQNAADKYTVGYSVNAQYVSMCLGTSLDNTAYVETPITMVIEYTKVSES